MFQPNSTNGRSTVCQHLLYYAQYSVQAYHGCMFASGKIGRLRAVGNERILMRHELTSKIVTETQIALPPVSFR